jgi:phytoene synthase
MNSVAESDFEYCQKAAVIPGSVFSVSYRFARPGFRKSLICLRALINEVRSIPYKVSEADVARVKIAWWRNELLPENVDQSQHPLVRALRENAVFKIIDHDLLDSFFSAVLEMTFGEPIENLDQLVRIARATGGAEALLECGERTQPSYQHAVIAIGEAGFLNRLLNDWTVTLCNDSWWVPLSIQAKHGISKADSRRSRANKNAHSAMQEIADLALKSLRKAIKDIGRVAGAEESDGFHHLLISAVIYEKRLMSLSKNSGLNKPAKSNAIRLKIGEVITAWRQAIRR